ncbi:hypothetical protein AgCh_012222 [Apium graveolens]
MKVAHDFKSDHILNVSEKSDKSLELPSKTSDCFEFSNREEYIVEDRDVLDFKDEEEPVNQSLLSRVPDTFDRKVEECGWKEMIYNQGYKGELIRDFPNLDDSGDKTIIQTGDCSKLGGSQKSLCDLLKKVKIKGHRRPKKKLKNRFPFDMVKSRRFFKRVKDSRISRGKFPRLSQRKALVPGSEEEVVKFLEIVEKLGMQLVETQNEALEVVENQLNEGNI